MLVMNGMNISPLMYATEYDHLFCLFRGDKRLVLVNAQQYPDVRQVRDLVALVFADARMFFAGRCS